MEEIKTEKKLKLRQRHPIVFWGCVVIEGLAILLSIVSAIMERGNFIFMLIAMNLPVIPAVLTFINIFLIFIKPKDERKWKMKARGFEIISTVVGFGLSAITLSFFARYADWHTQIAIGENHSPIWIRSIPTVVILCLIGIAGYLILAFTHAKKTPPLVTVLAISALSI